VDRGEPSQYYSPSWHLWSPINHISLMAVDTVCSPPSPQHNAPSGMCTREFQIVHGPRHLPVLAAAGCQHYDLAQATYNVSETRALY